MQRMKFSYITPRPVHNGQDKSKQEEFKKNLNETIVFSKTNDKRLKWYYQLKGVSLYIRPAAKGD